MVIGSQKSLLLLRTTLQQTLDELDRINASHACVRPDVSYAARQALHETFVPEIEHASDTERRIVGKLVHDALMQGYPLSVWDGEEMCLVESIDPDEVYKALASTDSDVIYVHSRSTNPPGVVLIWGNECDVISDYNTSLENLLKGANELAEKLDDEERGV